MTVANVFHRFLLFKYAFVIHTIVGLATCQYNFEYMSRYSESPPEVHVQLFGGVLLEECIFRSAFVDILAQHWNQTDRPIWEREINYSV